MTAVATGPGGAHTEGPRPAVAVVGVAGDRLSQISEAARHALNAADVVIGTPRLISAFRAARPADPAARRAVLHEVGTGADELVERVRQFAVSEATVGVLVGGDPGFFGIVGALGRVLDRASLTVHPAPSPVSEAFARLALTWDDAVVLDAEVVTLDQVVGVARASTKVAVCTSPGSPPDALGQALRRADVTMDLVAVCSALSTPDETIRELSLDDLATGSFDPDSIVILLGPGSLPLVGWGQVGPHDPSAPGAFGVDLDHAPGPAARTPDSPTRAVLFDALDVPHLGVLWQLDPAAYDVASQCARWTPGLTVFVIERAGAERDGDAGALPGSARRPTWHRIENPGDLGTLELPAPDRVLARNPSDVELDALMARLRPHGRLVATFEALGSAERAAERLGHLELLTISGSTRGAGGSTLEPARPLFIAWGPDAAS